MWRVFFAGLIVAIPSIVFAQATISEREAIAKIESWASTLCIRIPVGVYRTGPPPMWSDSERYLARTAMAFEKLGIVTVTSMGNLMENTLTVQLRPDFDRSNLISPTGDAPCLRTSTGLKISKVTRIDATQGGSAIKWNASLVYILYDFPATPLARQYHEAMQTTGGFGTRKGVYLFRQDPFNQQWTFRTLDAADINAELALNNVANSLRRD